jgi:hypothetical protein
VKRETRGEHDVRVSVSFGKLFRSAPAVFSPEPKALGLSELDSGFKYIYIVLLVLAILCAGYAGLKGIDFGRHWDEDGFTETMVRTFETKTLLPGWYDYGSVAYTLTLFPAVTTAIDHYATTRLGVTNNTLAAFAPFAREPWFKLKLRREFLMVSLAALIWVALLAFVLQGSWRAAAFAGMFLASSWEFMYHARWVAVDTIMAQFAILTLLLIYVAIEKDKPVWLRVAAVVGGIALGSKYPAGLLLLSVLLAVWLMTSGWELRKRRWELRIVTAIFFGAFLLTTPGVIYQPFFFIRSVYGVFTLYSTSHGGHTVLSRAEHVRLIFTYLALFAMSKYRFIAATIFGLSIAGAVGLWRERRWKAIPLLGFAALYLAYFSYQHVMVVRNLQVIIPILAVLAAVGWNWISSKMPSTAARLVLDVVLVTAVGFSLAWQVSAAQGIANRRNIDHSAALASYLSTDAGRQSFVTPRVSSKFGEAAPVGVPLDQARYVVYDSDEVQDWTTKLANVPGRYRLISSIYDCNFDYYPDWIGDERILAVDKQFAFQLGVVK